MNKMMSMSLLPRRAKYLPLLLALGMSLSERASGATRTWTGNSSANWSVVNGFDSVPVSGDALVFNAPGTAGNILNNNLTSTAFTVAGMTFNAGYTINGNAFTLTNGITVNNSTVTLNNAMAFSGAQTFTHSGGSILRMAGVLSGSGGFTSAAGSGGGYMELQNGANSFTGNVTINSGQVYAEAFGVSGSTSTLGSQAIAGRTITINSTGYLGFLSNDIFGTATSGVANIPSIIINGGQGAVLYSTRYNALGNVTLNGGKLDQQSTDTGNFEGYQFLGTITVGGTSQSTISSLGQRNHLGANTTFNVGSTGMSNASVVGDLVVTTPLINQSGNFGLAAGALTKTGAGTMRLTGASTYSGGTTINAGSLLANGVGSGTTSSATGTGVVTVNGSGTTLGGTGAIAGAVTINGGAQITGGSAGTVGTLTLRSNVTFSGTSGNLATFFVDLASGANNSDRLTIGGTLNLGTVFDRIAFSGTADGVSSYTLATYSSLNGTFDSVLNMPNGYELQYTGSDLTLVPVPEPSTWVAALLTAAVLGYSQRRRLAGVLARRPA